MLYLSSSLSSSVSVCHAHTPICNENSSPRSSSLVDCIFSGNSRWNYFQENEHTRWCHDNLEHFFPKRTFASQDQLETHRGYVFERSSMLVQRCKLSYEEAWHSFAFLVKKICPNLCTSICQSFRHFHICWQFVMAKNSLQLDIHLKHHLRFASLMLMTLRFTHAGCNGFVCCC